MPLADDARQHAQRGKEQIASAVRGDTARHNNLEEDFAGPIGDGPQGPQPTAPYREYTIAETQETTALGRDAPNRPRSEKIPHPSGDDGGNGSAWAPDDGITQNTEPWAELPAIDYTGSGIEPTPAGAPLAQAWAAVMAEVQEIRKEGRFSGGGASYVYRGVDAVVNQVGPALRKHRVIILPIKMTPSYRDVNVGAKGTPMRECTMNVTYRIIGTRADEEWIVEGQGESLDSGDKGTTKAGTVAYRNMLLTALSVPVDNPRLDADHQEYRRAEQPVQLPSPVALRDEALNPRTSYERLNQVYGDINPKNPTARFARLGHAIVVNEGGNEEKLAALYWRKRKEHPDAPKTEEPK